MGEFDIFSHFPTSRFWKGRFSKTHKLQIGAELCSQEVAYLKLRFSHCTLSFVFPLVAALVEFAASDACDESICSDDFYNWSGLEATEDAAYDPVRNLMTVLGYTEEDVFGN